MTTLKVMAALKVSKFCAYKQAELLSSLEYKNLEHLKHWNIFRVSKVRWFNEKRLSWYMRSQQPHSTNYVYAYANCACVKKASKHDLSIADNLDNLVN